MAAASSRGGQAVCGQLDGPDRRGADMAREVLELAFRVDNRDRRIVEGLFDNPPQGTAFAGTRATLNEQSAGKEPVEVEVEWACRVVTQWYAIVRGLGQRPERGDAGHDGGLSDVWR